MPIKPLAQREVVRLPYLKDNINIKDLNRLISRINEMSQGEAEVREQIRILGRDIEEAPDIAYSMSMSKNGGVPVLTDADGLNPDYTDSTVECVVYANDVKLAYESSPGLGKWMIHSESDSGNISYTKSTSVDGNLQVDITALTGDEGSIDFLVKLENSAQIERFLVRAFKQPAEMEYYIEIQDGTQFVDGSPASLTFQAKERDNFAIDRNITSGNIKFEDEDGNQPSTGDGYESGSNDYIAIVGPTKVTAVMGKFFMDLRDNTTNEVYDSVTLTHLVDGVDGDDGWSHKELFIFIRSASAPSTPTGGSYDFGTEVLSPPASWSTSIPAEVANANDIYVCTANAAVEGNTGVDSTLTWSTPVRMQTDGQAVNIVYQRSASAPSTPSDSSGVPSGWYDDPGSAPGSDVLWASVGTKADPQADWVWQTPVQQEGNPGYSYAEVTIYKRGASTPSTPTGGTYDFATKGLSSVPSGWSATVPAEVPGSNNLYASITSASAQGNTGTDSSLTWSAPAHVSEDGEGVNIVFRRASSQPSTPSDSSGVPSGWYDDIGSVPDGVTVIWGTIGTRPDAASDWTWQTPILMSEETTDILDAAPTIINMDEQVKSAPSAAGEWGFRELSSNYDPDDLTDIDRLEMYYDDENSARWESYLEYLVANVSSSNPLDIVVYQTSSIWVKLLCTGVFDIGSGQYSFQVSVTAQSSSGDDIDNDYGFTEDDADIRFSWAQPSQSELDVETGFYNSESEKILSPNVNGEILYNFAGQDPDYGQYFDVHYKDENGVTLTYDSSGLGSTDSGKYTIKNAAGTVDEVDAEGVTVTVSTSGSQCRLTPSAFTGAGKSGLGCWCTFDLFVYRNGSERKVGAMMVYWARVEAGAKEAQISGSDTSVSVPTSWTKLTVFDTDDFERNGADADHTNDEVELNSTAFRGSVTINLVFSNKTTVETFYEARIKKGSTVIATDSSIGSGWSTTVEDTELTDTDFTVEWRETGGGETVDVDVTLHAIETVP